LRITGASAGNANLWKLFNTPPHNAVNDTNNRYGKSCA